MVRTAAVFIFIIISLVLVKFWGNLTDGSPHISQVPTKLSLSCNSFKIILAILKPGPTRERVDESSNSHSRFASNCHTLSASTLIIRAKQNKYFGDKVQDCKDGSGLRLHFSETLSCSAIIVFIAFDKGERFLFLGRKLRAVFMRQAGGRAGGLPFRVSWKMANFKHCFKRLSKRIGFSRYLWKSGLLHFGSKNSLVSFFAH